METVNLKARVLIPLAFVSLLVLGLFITSLYFNEQTNLSEDLARSIHSVDGYYQAALESRAQKLGAALDVLLVDGNFQSALAERDRQALLEMAAPIFEKLKTRHNVTHFYFHDPQRINILRVHQPARHSDTINRYTALGAERTGRLFHGVELGPLGTFTLRAVQPVWSHDKLLGYLELGEEVDQIVQDMHRLFDVELVVKIHKQYLHQSDWTSGMRLLGRPADWNYLPESVIVSQTFKQLPHGLDRALSDQTGTRSKPVTLHQEKQHYNGRMLPLHDAGNRLIGGILVLRDMSQHIQSNWNTVATVSTGTITAALILLSFFYLLLGRTELQLQSSIRQLRENEQHLAHAQHIAHIGSWELDIKQQIMRWSDEIYEIFELNPHSSQIGFSTFTDFAHPEDRPAVEQRLANGLNQHKTCEITYRIQLQDKRIKYIRVLCEFNLDEAAQATAASGTVHDITEQKKTEMLSARMGNIFEHSWNEIYAFDAHSLLFLDVSDGAQHNLGYSMEELRQLTPYDIKPEISREQFIAMIEPLRQGRQRTLNYETIHQRKDGSTYPVEARLQISTEQSPPVFMTIVQDITERKQYIEKLEHKTLYDDLTDLPNHFLLRDRLEHAMKVARRQATMLAVLVIDVKRLREINNLMGHFNGDLVLKEVAQRLALRLRESDTVARLSGDEFAVVLSNLNIEHVYLVAAKIQRIFEQPILVDDTPLEIEAAIGVALYPDHGDDPDILIQHADIAMHIAKNGAGGLNVYNPDDDPYSLQRLKLHGELREAISKKMLVLHYQPKIDLKTCNIISVEALSRWSHPQDGMISPVDFIPMIEQSGMIRPFTLWILEQAIMQCRRWTDAGIDLSIAVNLSTRNLLDPTLPDFIASMLAMYQVSADRLSLEITESAVMSRPESAVTLLNRLHDMGIKLSIDDFGTGYSSLTYLKKLPVQELKIDQSFIFNLNQSEDDAVIVRSTIDLAHNLGLSVVAEGVESRTILETLTTLRCDIGQGYFFSRPLPANELEDWLTTTSWGLPAVSPKPASSRL